MSRTRRTRRTRFVVNLSPQSGGLPIQRQILAYDAMHVRSFYERQGYVVGSIAPVRRGALTASPAPSGGGWTLDRMNLQQAVEFFGLKLPVEVKQTGHQGGRMAAHVLDPRGGSTYTRGGRIYNLDTATHRVHKITVKSWLTAEQAGRALWHELQHAAQAERVMTPGMTPADHLRAWNRTLRSENGGIAYMRKPIEVEAREAEPLNDDCPLARSAR